MSRAIWVCLFGLVFSAFPISTAHQENLYYPLSTTGEGVNSRFTQRSETPNANVTLVDLTGYQSAGVYLGHGLILTSWQSVAGERLLWNGEAQIAAQLRYQLPTYLDDGKLESWEQAIGLTLCRSGDLYRVVNLTEVAAFEDEKSENPCITYDLAQGMNVTTPDAAGSLPVNRLLYADRTYDIALLEIDDAALTQIFPALTPAQLDSRPLQRSQILNTASIENYYDLDTLYFVLNALPSLQNQPAHGNFDGSAQQTTVIPVQPILPERLGQTRPTLQPAQHYYSAEGGMVGLYWGKSPDGIPYITPTTEWYNALWSVSEALDYQPLSAVLQTAWVPEKVAGLNTIGDTFSPELGNTGYDILHYNLALTIDPFSRFMEGTATLQIKATYHHLASFTLDLRIMTVAQVTINGETVPFTQFERKLLIELPTPLDYGTEFEVAIQYSGVPVPTDTPYSNFFTVGLEYIQDQPRMAFVNQPDGANTWFPCNDHPLDQATYEFHVTTPSSVMAIANGVPDEPTPASTTQTTYHWRMDEPMATNLAVVAIGDYSLVTDTTHDGLLIRNYAYTGTEDKVKTLLSSTDLAFRYLRTLFGPYPFDSYGHVVTPLPNGAVETQTMTIMPRSLTQADNEEALFTLVVHELAHQWYGDAVALKSWRDIWLNEGFATYAEWLALELRYGPDNPEQTRSIQERALRNSQRETPLAYPLVGQMFGAESYVKGAWVLHMLRGELGNVVFFDVLRTWAVEYANYPVTTLDFFRLAEQISGRDLAAFRRQWLENSGIPEYQLVWTYGKRGLEVAACNLGDVIYDIRLPIEFLGYAASGAEVKITEVIELNSSEVQQFDLEWMPSAITIDAEQQVLENVTTLYTEGQASCLLATPR